MPAELNLVGQRFTRLLVLEKRGKTQSGQYRYLCRCDCGVEKVVATGELRYGKTKSCGCYSKDKARTRLYKHGRSNRESKDYYEYHRETYIKRKYNLSLNEYNDMLESQNEECYICGYKFGQKKGDICVDHCHDSNIVRGLLCDRCNRGLGYFMDNIDSLEKAVMYLKDPPYARNNK